MIPAEGARNVRLHAQLSPIHSKIYVDGPQGVRVPMREIALSGGEPPLRVYDTSGPQGHDVETGCRSCASRGSSRGARRPPPASR